MLIPVMAVIFRVGLLDVINLNFSFFRWVFLKWRKFCQPYKNYGDKQYYCLADPIIIR